MFAIYVCKPVCMYGFTKTLNSLCVQCATASNGTGKIQTHGVQLECHYSLRLKNSNIPYVVFEA